LVVELLNVDVAVSDIMRNFITIRLISAFPEIPCIKKLTNVLISTIIILLLRYSETFDSEEKC